jgi:hypothetical protein
MVVRATDQHRTRHDDQLVKHDDRHHVHHTLEKSPSSSISQVGLGPSSIVSITDDGGVQRRDMNPGPPRCEPQRPCGDPEARPRHAGAFACFSVCLRDGESSLVRGRSWCKPEEFSESPITRGRDLERGLDDELPPSSPRTRRFPCWWSLLRDGTGGTRILAGGSRVALTSSDGVGMAVLVAVGWECPPTWSQFGRSQAIRERSAT